MNRRGFLALIPAMTAGVVAAMSRDARPQRNLMDWLKDVQTEAVSRGHGVNVACGADALEYFRAALMPFSFTGHSPDFTHTSFHIDPYPYRWDSTSDIVGPYITGARVSRINPCWMDAPFEACLAWSGATLFYTIFRRSDHILL